MSNQYGLDGYRQALINDSQGLQSAVPLQRRLQGGEMSFNVSTVCIMCGRVCVSVCQHTKMADGCCLY